MGENSLKNKYYFQILALLLSFILLGCQSILSEAVTSEPSVDVSPPTQIDSGIVTKTTNPTTTLSPTPAFTPTPANTDFEYPATSLENQELLDSNADGTLVYPTWSAKEDDEYTFPVTPAYLWDIQHSPNTDIQNVVIEFDIHATAGAEILGYDRGIFVGLYNLDPIAQENVHEAYPDDVAVDREEILRGFLWQEDLIYADHQGTRFRDFVTITQGDDGVLHYRLEIPYEQFNGGKNTLAFQPLPGTVFTTPRVTVKTNSSELSQDEIMAIISGEISYANPFIPHDRADSGDYTQIDHTWFDQFFAPEWIPERDDWNLSLPEDEGAVQQWRDDRFPMHAAFMNFDGSLYMMPAVDVGLEGQVAGDYVLDPAGILQYHHINAMMSYSPDIDLTINANIEFMINNMTDPSTIDPETGVGLIYGVWDYESNSLVATDRRYSNIALVSAAGYYESRGDTRDKLTNLLLRAMDAEIINYNDQLVIAPDGIHADGSIDIALQDLAWGTPIHPMVAALNDNAKAVKGSNPERAEELRQAADKLITAYANTLQLVLDAQNNTPSNLLSSNIKVIAQPDGSYSFEYIGDFDISNSFYFQSAIQYEGNADWLNVYVGDPGLFAGVTERFGRIKYFTGEAQDKEWEEFIRDANRFDKAHKINFAIYSILYNIYTASDGNYARYYDVTTGQPIYPERIDGEHLFDEYSAFYNIPGILAWNNLLRFFHDAQGYEETYDLLYKGMVLFLTNATEGNPSPLEYSQIGDLGIISARYYLANLRPFNETGGNLSPWGYNSNLAWRESLDEALLRLVEEHGIKANWPDWYPVPRSP